MGIFRDIEDYFRDKISDWRNRKAAEKEAYGAAYMDAKLGLLKEKGKLDARRDVFGKDAVKYETEKVFERGVG